MSTKVLAEQRSPRQHLSSQRWRKPLGWIGLVMLVCRRQSLRRWTRPLAAVGRTALSNYLLQTVVATFLMYSWGLGYFGDVPRPWQIALVLAIYALQIPLSILWLRFFTIGPMEWIWRSLTYRKRQPMRRRTRGA